jgi:hypothetical protein
MVILPKLMKTTANVTGSKRSPVAKNTLIESCNWKQKYSTLFEPGEHARSHNSDNLYYYYFINKNLFIALITATTRYT